MAALQLHGDYTVTRHSAGQRNGIAVYAIPHGAAVEFVYARPYPEGRSLLRVRNVFAGDRRLYPRPSDTLSGGASANALFIPLVLDHHQGFPSRPATHRPGAG